MRTGLPIAPSPTYMLELGKTHLIDDNLLRGSQHAVVDAMDAAGLPDQLRPPVDWQFGGHYGEIGKTAEVLDEDTKPPADRLVRAVHRSALLMGLVSVVDSVDNAAEPDRSEEKAKTFFDNTRRALVENHMPQAEAPANHQHVFRFAKEVGNRLQLVGRNKEALDEIFTDLSSAWLARLREGTFAHPYVPDLIDVAKRVGTYTTQLAAVAVLGHKGHPALAEIGAIGGLEEELPAAAIKKRMHSYTTALVQEYGGEEGLALARRWRNKEEARLYANAQTSLSSRRHRQAVGTVIWFARVTGFKRRFQEGLIGPRRAEAVKALERAVQDTNWS